MHFAKHSAANALIDGWKSVELCQAYILMSIYAVPAKKWEEDRSWLYTGLAIRYVICHDDSILRDGEPLLLQDCDRFEFTSCINGEAPKRTAGKRNIESDACVAYMLQFGPLDSDTVWEAGDYQRGLVRF
jgi:hypothetical protein